MKVIKQLFGSKKFLVMVSAIVVYVASRFGLDVDPETADKLLALVGVYLLGQGIADHGKGAVQTAAATAVPLASPVTVTPATVVPKVALQPPPLQPPPGLP